MSYKVEELLALRDSVSESAVSLDRFADEEVIKEHVLRPSASATLASAASEKSLRATLTPAIAHAAPYKKPSPSPSIKRGKAERLLKEHGSPPGMRVTAGGRVVPSDLPPLSNNRFVNANNANNAFKPPTLRGTPVGNIMPVQARHEAGSVPRLEVVGNQPVLYVGDRAYALPALDAPASGSSMQSANMENTAKPALPPPILSAQSSFTNAPAAPVRPSTHTPFTGLDLATLKSQQALRKQELRSVEQTEVLQASHQTDAWRAGIIEKKRNLIIELDALRKQITSLEAADNTAMGTQMNGFSSNVGAGTAPAPAPPFVPQFQQPMPSPMFGYPGAAPYSPMMMYPPSFGSFPNMPPTEAAPFVPTPIQKPLSPGSASRRSHAIAIKPPQEDNKKQMASTLDPKSPTYEPVSKGSNKAMAPPTPSPNKHSPWRTDEATHSDKHEDRTVSQKQSLSSIDTTDFFPTNTHEHSSTRVAPKAQETTAEPAAVPSTPEKNWPASPWNEGHSSRSSRKAVTKLTSWPEAFGKPPSVPSLRQVAGAQTSATTQEHAPVTTSDFQRSTFTNNMAARRSTDQRTDTDENWTLMNSRPVSHVPSTYQEGYQAGYDHVGIPDSPEVLKGYIQGLLQFLSDENKKGKSGQLRGLVAGSTPHDSAVSMSFNRADAPVTSQENMRSAKYAAVDIRRDSAYGLQEAPISYTLCNDSVDSRMRKSPMNTYRGASDSLDKTAAYKQIALAAAEKDAGKKRQDKGTVSRADTFLNGSGYPRQFSGNQLNSRAYGTPVSMQRYHLSPKELAANGPGANMPLSARPFANHSLSGLDGAMDDLADVVLDTHIDEQRSTTEGRQPEQTTTANQDNDEDVSCFRPTSSKSKQKSSSSPTKFVPNQGTEEAASSPANIPGSPKKSGEHSPAKAKLEQVTNKFRRGKKEDPRNMSPDEKSKRSQKWHKRFQRLKEGEQKDIERHIATNPRRQ
ncbi:hypothetical protein CC80DRAFT_593756 [Byssothecium circinans]|uniref:Uncharacterized protein n=1 Tax=Byssothecium circinans TaxID=147558 RepID=A0A6A5TX46_9PLEO|nr:hypothetical protein CC80DRAFT_593756 [Byssothecium circinans]